LRGTGEGFAANVGGRMIGTSAAFFTTQITPLMAGAAQPAKLAHAAALVALLVYAWINYFLLADRTEAGRVAD